MSHSTVQEWFEEHNNFEVLNWPPNSLDHSRSAGQSPIHGGPTSQFTGLKGPAANILVPDTTAHLQGSMPRQVRAVLAAKGGPTQ